MESQLIITGPKQADRSKPNYANFYNERMMTPKTIQRSTINDRFAISTIENDGDYLLHENIERNPNERIRTRRVQALDIGAALKNILYGSTTWRDDATQIVAAIYAVEDGKGTISEEGWYVPSANFRSEGINALGKPIPLDKLLIAVRDLMLDELQRPSPSDLQIMSRQADVIQALKKTKGTKFRIKLSRSFKLERVTVQISPTAFRYDSDYINIWRLMTGNAFAIRPAVHSLINHWILMNSKYDGQSESDRHLNLFELPSSDPHLGWTSVSRYNYWNAGHASARVARFILDQTVGLL
jgi:hypothetical protein